MRRNEPGALLYDTDLRKEKSAACLKSDHILLQLIAQPKPMTQNLQSAQHHSSSGIKFYELSKT